MNKITCDLAVGMDVASEFTYYTIMHKADGQVGKANKIVHDDTQSLENAVDRIKEAQEKYKTEACCFVESTGVYHIPLVRFFKDHGLRVIVINPIVTKYNTNGSVRNVHSDKADSRKIAQVALSGVVTPSILPDDEVLGMRCLTREYFSLSDEKTAQTLGLNTILARAFPGFASVFSKLTTKTALAVLEQYPTPGDVLKADVGEIIDRIRLHSRRGGGYAKNKAGVLVEAAESAIRFGRQTPADAAIVRSKVRRILQLETEKKQILHAMEETADAEKEAKTVVSTRLELLQTIPGVGFLSAFALIAEIGDFGNFSRPKELVAFCGLDPRVRQSGKFTADKTHMSKCGNPILRRVLHQIAVYNIGVDSSTGCPLNPPLHAYYTEKCKAGKKKPVVLGALAHKVCNIVFAVLRDEASYVARTPEEHNAQYQSRLKRSVG